MARTDKFMPVYIADYLGDTSHLGMAEHGAYLLLLFHYWRTQQPLPDDDQQLQRITRGSKTEWRAVAAVVRAFFKEAVINGVRVLVHSRVERELVRARDKSEAKQKASRIANAVRWASQTESQTDTQTESHTVPPSPSPSHSAVAEKSISPVPGSKPPPKPKSVLNGHEKDFNEFWAVYPKRVDKRDAMKAYAKALGRADALVILDGAKGYARSRKDEDAQFTKGPAHWLNADCWLDEAPLADGDAPDPKLAAALEVEAEFRRKHGDIE